MKLILGGLFVLLTLEQQLMAMPPVQKVFVIVMENQGWSAFKGNPSAPYINGTLLPAASYCERFYAIPGLHPSEPNYLWMEAGTNFGIFDNNDPSINHQNTTNHLVAQLRAAGISWKTYQEDISGTYVPLVSTNLYTPRHNPFVYFDDVTGTNNPNDAYGIAHIRPYSELAADLAGNTVARYNFIKPNLCNDGHDSCAPLYNPVSQVDAWLAAEVPAILNSQAWSNNGALFITWDESFDDSPIGMIVLSPLIRSGGYFNSIPYTLSSMLRTLQEVFGVRPYLGDAALAKDLSDLFIGLRFTRVHRHPNGQVELTATVLQTNRLHLVQASTDLVNWTAIHTNGSASSGFIFTDVAAATMDLRFYRLVQLP